MTTQQKTISGIESDAMEGSCGFSAAPLNIRR
jgi:hypothetical protein